MLSLNLPVFDTKINVRNGKNVIFDVIRKRYVALTPEEWVRQHFVHFLIAHKGRRTSDAMKLRMTGFECSPPL